MSKNSPSSEAQKRNVIVGVAATVPSSQAVTEMASKMGNKLTVKTLENAQKNTENKLNIVTNSNKTVKEGVGQEAKSGVSSPSPKKR